MGYDVTIGMPVYKSVDYIKRSLESALSQSYLSVEFLIVDDAGCDGSMAVVRNFQKTHPRGQDIHIITHQANQGVSASRNQLIDEAQGEYLYFMDSDDIISTDCISLLMQQICQCDAEIAFGSYEKIGTDGRREVYQYPELQLLGEDQLASFSYRKYAGIQASACNYLVKTSLLREYHHRFIDTNYWEDFVFTFDLVTLVKRAVLLPNITYTYVCRENSLSHYQERPVISKDEILQNIRTIDELKKTSLPLCHKKYFPHRCFHVVMTDFYMACHILKRRKGITPSVSHREIRDMMRHPATWHQICHFRQARWQNMLLFLLGKLPPSCCVMFIWSIGNLKKII